MESIPTHKMADIRKQLNSMPARDTQITQPTGWTLEILFTTLTTWTMGQANQQNSKFKRNTNLSTATLPKLSTEGHLNSMD